MPDQEKSDEGRVVYHRLGGAEGEGHALPPGEGAAGGGAVGRRSLWQAVVPLLIGFTLLVGLVIGLGLLSDDKLEDITLETSQDERRLSNMFANLLNLQLALSKLHTEARIRAQVEAGTEGVLRPPTDMRVRREREAVEELLKNYDNLPLTDESEKLEVRRLIEAYIEATKDLE